jgi:hypothetical protein
MEAMMAWLWGQWGSDRTGGSAAWCPMTTLISNCTAKTMLNFTWLGPYMQNLPYLRAIKGHLRTYGRPTANGQTANGREPRQTESAIAFPTQHSI